MKARFIRIFAVFIVFICVLSSCKNPSASPTSLTPSVRTIRPSLGDGVYFLDFDGGNFLVSRFLLPTGGENPNASFLLDSESGENTELGFFSSAACFYGENYCYFKRGEEGTLNVVSVDLVSGEKFVLFSTCEGNFSLFRSGGYIIAVCVDEERLYAAFYNIESGETTYTERHGNIAYTDLRPVNGFISYTEKLSTGSAIMAIDPRHPEKEIKASETLSSKVISSSFDGDTFVWNTYNGIFYCKEGGEPQSISEENSKLFGLIGEHYLLYSSDEKVLFYDIEDGSSVVCMDGNYNLKFFDGNEQVVVLEPEGLNFGEEYIVVSFTEN